MSTDENTARPENTVLAGWAVVSKRLDPSGRLAIDGYEIVGTSGSMAFAQSLQGACLTGTPSSTAVDTQDALPWVIVTAGGSLGAVTAMSVVTSSTIRTEGGRPVTPTRLLWTNWADAARCRMSWSAMLTAHRSLRWSDTILPADAQGAPVAVEIADTAAGTVADDIDRFGFDWVAGLAGMVLDGRRIAIVAETTPLPGVDERLKLFDAVCGLLPYGYRARFSAASWAKANVESGILLVFSDAVAKDQRRVGWQSPAPQPHSSDATAYVETLLRLRHGEARFSSSDIVQHLLGESDPRRCGDAAAALTGLLRMDLPRETARLIRSGRGSVANVRLALSEHSLDSLPSEIAQTLVQFLADSSGRSAEAADLLVQVWSPETERRLGAYGRSFLTPAGLPHLYTWFELADRAGSMSKLALLRELLRPTATVPDLTPESADTAVRLLAQFTGAINDVAIQRVIVDQPGVCVGLLRKILDRSISTARAVGLIQDWLRDHSAERRPWLASFGFAIGQGEPTDEQWRTLRTIDDRVWRVLLQIAASERHSERVFASMWPFLVDRAGSETTPNRDAAFEAELEAMTPTSCGLSSAEWPRIDLINLVRFGSMPGLRTGVVPIDAYGGVFGAAWYSPNLADRRAALNQRLVAEMFPRSGTADQATLLMSVVASNDPELTQLAAQAIAREIDRRPAAFDSVVFSPEWIDQIRGFSAKEGFWAYQALRTLAGTSPATQQIAAGYAQGLRVGLSHSTLERALRQWFRGQSPQLIEQLLIDLLDNDAANGAEMLRRSVVDGQYGVPTAERWRDFVQDRQMLAQWLVGKTKPPRRRRADSGTGGRIGAARKRIGSMLPGFKGADGDQRPAADN